MKLNAMIECAAKELELRERLLPARSAKGGMAPTAVAHEIAMMADILATLRWLKKWEPVVKKAVHDRQRDIEEARKSMEAPDDVLDDPAVQAVLEVFPDAKVTVKPHG